MDKAVRQFLEKRFWVHQKNGQGGASGFRGRLQPQTAPTAACQL
jgi:hypothetical protein